ncbi:MAG TPA: GatB/YqeY domain-containing protein [Candidatus Kapabacteria bacterium]|nr:GatB/YqeY domain-containing protein [Candidatus Kapabacteria bacterium]
MTLGEKITEDLTNAMKAGDKLRLETLRMLRAAMLELQKSGKEISPDDELRAVQNQGKRRKDAAEQYRAAGRADLAEKEEAELKIIEEYLPQQLGEDEIRAQVRVIIAEAGASGPGDFKLVMPKAMGALRGRADGARVQAIVKEELGAG